MVPNFSLNLGALNALAPNSGGMFSSIAPVVAPTPFVAPVATPVAPIASTAPVASPMAPTGLLGATNIFGDRAYEAPLATPGRTRVGYSEMLKLNQAPGYVTTNRPEQIGDLYLPFRPSGEGNQVADDIKTWYNYYNDNPDLKKFLSADEQTELTWLDYRNKKFDQDTFTKKINDIRAQFNLPQKVGFKDFEAHFSYGTKRKKYSDNPYSDLQQYGPSIGGYWNPENDPSETQQALANPLVNAVLTTAGSALGNLILPGVGGQALGAALAGGTTSKLSGADWEDALKAAAISGGSAYLAGQMAGPKAAPTSEFNIPNTNFISDSLLAPAGLASPPSLMPLGGINTNLITESLLAPTAASAIANPTFNLAAPSFFQTAVGQGLGKAGLALASGADPKDALTVGLFGAAGAPGGVLSSPISSVGANFGTSQVGQALNNLSIADALKFGVRLPQEQWSAVGGLFGDLDLGSVSEYGAFNILPKGIQNALENVQLNDVLAQVGGPNYGSLFNIAQDINVPSISRYTNNIFDKDLVDVPEWLQDIFDKDLLDLPRTPSWVNNLLDKDLIDIPEGAEQAAKDAKDIVRDLNKPDLPSSETAAQKATSGFGNLFGGGTKAEPFMAQVSYNPNLPQLTPIAYSDPLSVLLAEFYKT